MSFQLLRPFLVTGVFLASAALAAPNEACLTGSAVSQHSDRQAQSVLAELLDWVSARTGQRDLEMPRICRVSQRQLARMRHGDSAGSGPFETLALYRRAPASIFVSAAFEPSSPVSRSIIVHELVHHAQARAGRRFACPQLAEREALEIQDEWLRQFGLDVKGAFGINDLGYFLLTNCGI